MAYDDSIIRSQYIDFCRNPLRSEAQLSDDFDELIHHPRVQAVAFHTDEWLMVGTDCIVITYEGRRYTIGEFIIYIGRCYDDGYWDVSFAFENVSRVIDKKVMHNSTQRYHHPHICEMLAGEDELPGVSMCISKGQFSVYQAIRKGHVHQAIFALIEILEIFPTGKAYHPIENWPSEEVCDA